MHDCTHLRFSELSVELDEAIQGTITIIHDATSGALA